MVLFQDWDAAQLKAVSESVPGRDRKYKDAESFCPANCAVLGHPLCGLTTLMMRLSMCLHFAVTLQIFPKVGQQFQRQVFKLTLQPSQVITP